MANNQSTLLKSTSSASLPFAFCRDNQIVLSGDILKCSTTTKPQAIIEARRALGQIFDIEILEQEAFSRAFDACFATSALADFDDEDDVIFESGPNGSAAKSTQDLMEDTEDAPVIELVNQIFRRAIRSGASDVHIEPAEKGLRVRMRLNGILRPVLDRPDAPVERIISRLKVMAGLDTAETRRPQDGRIGLRFAGRAIDVRFSSLAGQHGERLVLRVLDRRAGLRSTEELGISAGDEATLHRITSNPNGIVLVVGPTGSGKTTTLYSLLNALDQGDRNIITIEDPIEYEFPNISQTQVNADIGLTFASGLRATLRQDPDVILVGEIRDIETAEVAAQAALTGHLVLSSLHAESCVKAVTRLRNLGLTEHFIASTVRGILAQRLVRRICDTCGGQGCADCSDTGYGSRIGTFEICEFTPAISAAIEAGDDSERLAQLILSDRKTMHETALDLARTGITTREEVARIFGTSE